jgi:DNA polymerase-1
MEWRWFNYHYGIELNNVDDTIQIYHMLDERTKGNDKSLKGLGENNLGIPPWKDPLKPYLSRMEDAPKKLLVEYLCRDIEATEELKTKFYPVLQTQGLDKCYESLIRPGLVFLCSIAARGIRMDLDKLEEVRDQLTPMLKEQKDGMYETSGEKGWNPNSPNDLSRIMYEVKKFKRVKGNSTDKVTVADLMVEYNDPFLWHLDEYRKLSKLLSTYVNGLDKACGMDGRLHTTFKMDGTTTGRLSSSKPNLQNIPSRGKYAKLIKGLFIPDDGCELFDVDFSQLELRVGAHLYEDDVLIEYLHSGKDFHKEMASLIFGIPENQVTKEQRNLAKQGVFGTMYDMKAREAFYNLRPAYREMTMELATKIVELPKKKFEKLALGSLSTQLLAMEQGYVETLYGRRRRFPLITRSNRDDVLKQSVNAPIQGTASDMCLLSAMRIAKLYPEVKVHILVHDSIVGSMPKGFDVKKLQEVCSDVGFKTRVPFATEAKVGEKWG